MNIGALGACLLDKRAVPGAVVTLQTFGQFLRYRNHLHILISDGCFYDNRNLTRFIDILSVNSQIIAVAGLFLI